MRYFASALLLLIFSTSAVPQQHAPLAKTAPLPQIISSKILAAKTAFFEDRSGVLEVGKAALDELKKWGRFQILSDKTQADLFFVLSSSPPKGGHIIYSGGQTGTIEKSGTIDEDPIPNYHKSPPVRAAYLTVFDVKTSELLWTDSHRWGGLLTGSNSAGARLISQLKKEMKK
jgi:hypothetical protein